MCDDSRAERRYWMQRVEALQKEMEQEDLERQRAQARPSARPATAEPTALPTRMPAMAAVAREAWTIGSVVAGIVVALSILLFSMPGAAATFVYVSNAEDGDIGDVYAAARRLAQARPRAPRPRRS